MTMNNAYIYKIHLTEKTPIPEVEASDDRLGSPILSPEEEPRDTILDRVYSDSEEEREYQVDS